jgi:hypothetical protein
MQQDAKVLLVMDDDLEDINTLKQVLTMAEDWRWELTLFAVVGSLEKSSRMLVTCLSPDKLKSRALDKRLAQIETLISIIRHDSCRLRARVAFGKRGREILRETEIGGYDLVIMRNRDDATGKKIQRDSRLPVWLLTADDFTGTGEIVTANAPRFEVDNRV